MGSNMFDTADANSGGMSEGILGRAIEGWRDKVLLATKVGMLVGDGPNNAGTCARHGGTSRRMDILWQ